MKRAFEKPYLFWLIGIFFAYFLLNAGISNFHILLRDMFSYSDTFKWGHFIASFVFSIIIAGLVAINSVYVYIKYKQHKKVGEEGIVACVGGIGGLATGVCTICTANLAYFIASLFNVTFSWIALPFAGIEVQAILIAALGLNLYFLNKTN